MNRDGMMGTTVVATFCYLEGLTSYGCIYRNPLEFGFWPFQ